MIPYNEIPLIPTIIAEMVVSQHDARHSLTKDQVREFADLCEVHCRVAYEAGARWMLKIAQANDGRKELAMWINHWLDSYLHNPAIMRRWVERKVAA